MKFAASVLLQILAISLSLPSTTLRAESPGLLSFFSQVTGNPRAIWKDSFQGALNLLGVRGVGDALEDPRLYSVTKEFGPTIIDVTKLPFDSKVASAQEKAWSSWWFPIFEMLLFRSEDGDSTLEKYDEFRRDIEPRRTRSQLGSAQKWQQEAYDPAAQRWEGLCDAWSLAAITHPEPVRPVEKNGITFSVGDLKGLLLKTYEAVDERSLKFYGVKFKGDVSSWVFPDIFPDQFHRFVTVELFRNKRAFVMDHDPGVAVWNVPVYKANFKMRLDPKNPNRVLVKMWLYYAERRLHSGERDLIGTKEISREYNYALQGTRNSQGHLVINDGEWLQTEFQNSRSDHPDFLIAVPSRENLIRGSKNPEIKVQVVDEILKGSF